MKVIRSTASELILRSRPEPFGKAFILVWASIFMGIPLFLLYQLVAGLGTMMLTCTRLEPTQVLCEKQQSKFLGFVQPPPVTFPQVLDANFRSKRGTDSDGDTTLDNWVTLTTSTGEVTLVEGAIRINGVKGSAKEMGAIADQMKQFLQSDRPSLVLQQNLHRQLGPSLFILAFISLFEIVGGAVVFSVFQSRLLVFDKQSDRLTETRYTLVGPLHKHYPLREMTTVAIESCKDSDGDAYYELKVLPKTACDIVLMSHPKRSEVEKVQNVIHTFLQAAYSSVHLG